MFGSVLPTEHEDGFSIFEALVAFLILSMVLAGSLQLISSTSRVLGAAQNIKFERSAISRVKSELVRMIVKNDGQINSEVTLLGRKIRLDRIEEDQFLASDRRLYRVKIWPTVEAITQSGKQYLGYMSLPKRKGE